MTALYGRVVQCPYGEAEQASEGTVRAKARTVQDRGDDVGAGRGEGDAREEACGWVAETGEEEDGEEVRGYGAVGLPNPGAAKTVKLGRPYSDDPRRLDTGRVALHVLLCRQLLDSVGRL